MTYRGFAWLLVTVGLIALNILALLSKTLDRR